MPKLPPPPVLQIERSQPVQGKPVTVLFKTEGEFCGSLKLPYKIWIRLNKLLQKGLEKQQIEGPEAESAGLRVTVKGYIPQEGKEEEFDIEPVFEPATARPLVVEVPGSFGGVSNLAMEEEDLDPADKAAVVAAERTAATLEKLGRTLAEGEDNNG